MELAAGCTPLHPFFPFFSLALNHQTSSPGSCVLCLRLALSKLTHHVSSSAGQRLGPFKEAGRALLCVFPLCSLALTSRTSWPVSCVFSCLAPLQLAGCAFSFVGQRPGGGDEAGSRGRSSAISFVKWC